MEMAEYFGVARPTHPRPLHNAISTTKRGQRLPGGRQAQPGVATGNNVLAWRLGYAEVLVSRFHLRSNSELSSVKLIQTKQIFGHVIMKLAKISGLTGAAVQPVLLRALRLSFLPYQQRFCIL